LALTWRFLFAFFFFQQGDHDGSWEKRQLAAHNCLLLKSTAIHLPEQEFSLAGTAVLPPDCRVPGMPMIGRVMREKCPLNANPGCLFKNACPQRHSLP
jgi:hypothetical protein